MRVLRLTSNGVDWEETTDERCREENHRNWRTIDDRILATLYENGTTLCIGYKSWVDRNYGPDDNILPPAQENTIRD
jgi:hypothetical protein